MANHHRGGFSRSFRHCKPVEDKQETTQRHDCRFLIETGRHKKTRIMLLGHFKKHAFSTVCAVGGISIRNCSNKTTTKGKLTCIVRNLVLPLLYLQTHKRLRPYRTEMVSSCWLQGGRLQAPHLFISSAPYPVEECATEYCKWVASDKEKACVYNLILKTVSQK